MGRSMLALNRATVRKTPVWSHLDTKNDQITKTGSGQTWKTLREDALSAGDIDLGFSYGNGRTPGSLWAQYVRHSRWPMRTDGKRRGFRMVSFSQLRLQLQLQLSNPYPPSTIYITSRSS
jgi:hypothetical protein